MNLIKKKDWFTFSVATVVIFTMHIASFTTYAMQPPTKEQLARYKKQGSLQQKIVKAKAYGNFKVSTKLTNASEQDLEHNLNKKNYKRVILPLKALLLGKRGLQAKVIKKLLHYY